MSAKQHDKESKPKTTESTAAHDAPKFFRLNIEVGDLKAAVSFYTKLLGIEGRKQAGSRCYFDCGSVTLQVLDVSSARQPHQAAKSLYFTVSDLEAVYKRAKDRRTLPNTSVHRARGRQSQIVP
jgi:predicted enzyme related to lactoylglutathione lyase